ELLAQKRLGQWHPELVDELYRASLDLEQRGLKQTPEYRNALLRADEQAWRLVEWARLSGSDASAPPTAPAEQPDAPTQATDSPPAALAEQPDVSAQPTDSPPAAPSEPPDESAQPTDSPPAAPSEPPDESAQPPDSPPAASVHED